MQDEEDKWTHIPPDPRVPVYASMYMDGRWRPWPESKLAGVGNPPKFWVNHDGRLAYKDGSVAWPERQMVGHPDLTNQAQWLAQEIKSLLDRYGATLEGDEDGDLVIKIQEQQVGFIPYGKPGEFQPAMRWEPLSLFEGLAEYERQIAEFERITGEMYPPELREKVLANRR